MVSLNPFSWFKKKELVFPTKETQEASSCFTVLSLHGAAFCLDNQNIIFKDFEGTIKVIKPLKRAAVNNDAKNLSIRTFTKAVQTDYEDTVNYLVIKWENYEYYYAASFSVVYIDPKTPIFRLRNIKQDIHNIKVIDGNINVLELGEL